VHDGATISVEADDLLPRGSKGDPKCDGAAAAHASDSEEVATGGTLHTVLGDAVLVELTRRHAGSGDYCDVVTEPISDGLDGILAGHSWARRNKGGLELVFLKGSLFDEDSEWSFVFLRREGGFRDRERFGVR